MYQLSIHLSTCEKKLGQKDVYSFNDTTKKLQWLVFTSPVQSGFLPPKRATVNCNRSRTDPDIVGTEPDHLGPVFCGPWN